MQCSAGEQSDEEGDNGELESVKSELTRVETVVGETHIAGPLARTEHRALLAVKRVLPCRYRVEWFIFATDPSAYVSSSRILPVHTQKGYPSSLLIGSGHLIDSATAQHLTIHR